MDTSFCLYCCLNMTCDGKSVGEKKENMFEITGTTTIYHSIIRESKSVSFLESNKSPHTLTRVA